MTWEGGRFLIDEAKLVKEVSFICSIMSRGGTPVGVCVVKEGVEPEEAVMLDKQHDWKNFDAKINSVSASEVCPLFDVVLCL